MSHNPANNIPTIITVFGATGDLMGKKIIPSLFRLFEEDKIPNRFEVIGFARRPLSDKDFRDKVAASLKAHHDKPVSEKNLTTFLNLFFYQQGNFGEAESFKELNKTIGAIDERWGQCSNKLFYLAVPPEQFAPIFKSLASVGLNKPCSDLTGWTRLLIEKPFGKDAKTAGELEHLLSKYFKEEQLYRIDHYLAKEIVQGIIHFRFSNNLLESSWNNKTIEKIEVRLLETIGVEERGAFYDTVGALRDVGQNHLLEMLAAITMDYPASMSEHELRTKRAEIITTLKPWTKDSIKKYTYRAQYDGYEKIRGVTPGSDTETYYKLQTELTHPKWQGVPIIMESGKRAKEACKEIVVTFKHGGDCLMCTKEYHTQNKVVFQIEPQDKITIHFWTKKPGFDKVLEERNFTFFLYERQDKVQYVEEYGKLIHGSIVGDQTLFVSHDEVLAMWCFVDPILNAWKKNVVPLDHYKPDTEEMLVKSAHVEQASVSTFEKKIAVAGLGKMGGNLARRLLKHGWEVVAYNHSPTSVQTLEKEGAIGAYTLTEMVKKLPKRKIVWVMVPAGKPVDEVIFGKDGLVHQLKRGDIIIDGGNSYFKDTIARAKKIAKYGIHFFDVGTSGGPGGALNGACLMIGGDKKMFAQLELLFKDISKDGSYQFFEGVGAGHFVKMIHNGIEYGMMQALAEGFAIMKKSRFKLNLHDVTKIYNHGSVIESRLVAWLKKAFEMRGEELKGVSGTVGHTGEGAWTVLSANELKVKAKIIDESFKYRIHSEKHPDYTGKILSALREQFGGHSVVDKK